MATKICEYCNNLNPGDHKETKKGPNGEQLSLRIPFLQLGENCRHCSLLRNMVLHFAPDVVESSKDSSVLLDLEENNPINVEVSNTDEEVLALFYMYVQNRVEDLPSLGCLQGHHSPRSDADDCFQFVERNLDVCLSSHDECPKCPNPPLPKRVLRINNADTGDIKLVESHGKRAIYSTLSHCWGGFQPIKTTTASISEMLHSVPWSSLSMVFQDAVRVCRRLGIRYLWIDSLCIIQDSKDDWELESSKICDYYENSYITISAASSPNGTVPFLVGRDRRWRPQRFELVCRNGEVASIFGRRHPGSSTVQLIEDSGPLASRAWVWQETTLSTRVLHYMESELIWECKSHICSEDGTTPRGLYSMRLTRQMLHCVESPYNVWHKLVETYSIRELSFETDRLPALSGTANRVNSITQSNYLAGIWKEALPLDLCWSVDRTASLSSEVKIPSSQYIAPSWAWSSVKGPIVFVDDSGFIPLATVKEADCTVPGLNPYGQVSDGFITLHGLLAYIRITCTDPQSWWAYTIGDDPETREPMTADCALVEAYGTAKRASETDELEAFSLLAPCILIGKDETEEDAFFHVLVLGKQGSGDQYIRVGYAPLDSDAWFEDAVEETIRIL